MDQVQHRISLHEAYMSDTPTPTLSPMGRLSDPSPLPPAMLRRREAIDRKSFDLDTSPSSSSGSQAKGGGGGGGGGGRSSFAAAVAHRNITKHNSAPLFPAHVSSPSDDPPSQGGENLSCVIPHHPLSAQAIRVSMETKKDSKFKGSPVTALKNEIDKRFLSNGSETAPLEAASLGVGAASSSSSSSGVGGGPQGVERETDQKAVRQEMVSAVVLVVLFGGFVVGF